MKTISSRQNPWFKRLRDAVHDHAGEIVIEGPKQVADAIGGGWRAIAVIERGGEAEHPPENVSGTAHLSLSAELFDAVAETRATQGVMALFERPQFTLDMILRQRESIVVALDGVQDPGNVGSIVRLAAAFDAAGVALLPGCADAFGPKAIRASAAAILTVPVVNVTAHDLIAARIPLFAAQQTANAAAVPSKNAIIVFGSEGSGVSKEIAQSATSIAVPMSSRVESLNVATAAAILLWRSFEARSR